MHSTDPFETSSSDQGLLIGEGDELVRRLRGLKWTEVDPELRFRCWEQFSQRLAEKGLAPSSSPAVADGGDVYAFSRGERLRRTTGELRLPGRLRRVAQGPGGRLDLARPLSRRTGLSLAARVA